MPNNAGVYFENDDRTFGTPPLDANPLRRTLPQLAVNGRAAHYGR